MNGSEEQTGARAPAAETARRRGPVPSLIGTIAMPFYRAALSMRNRRFDQAVAGDGTINRVPLPVVSVGNLSVGGTGKTPMVRWLAQVLASQRGGGHVPMIALRGYRQSTTGGISDEAEEYRVLLPGVPIAIGADRFATISQTLANSPPNRAAPTVVLLDDGFQHRRLARDFDIVLLDATRPPMDDALLPAGWLREDMSALRRAHAVVVSRAANARPGVVDALLKASRAVNSSIVTAVASHVTTLPEAARDRRVLVVSGIGNPGPFTQAMKQLANVVGACEFEDHAAYDPARVRAIAKQAANAGAEFIVTTGKDAVKLDRLAAGSLPVPLVVARLEMAFERGESELAEAARSAVAAAGSKLALATERAT